VAKIRVVRQLEYVGEREWLERTLAKSLLVGHILECGTAGSIQVTSHYECPVETDSVTGAEAPHGS
jgi:hypothetical protein